MNNKTPEHLKDVPADKLKILSEVHKPRNSIGFAKDLAALVEESKPKPKTFVVHASETVCYEIKVQAIDDEQAKKIVLNHKIEIDWDKCRTDAYDFEINSVQE
jgi:hypothetical protein|tara:strand:- start:87 stop:395 length:309 start_codon:yes stop_codon:yes gene_type:complete